MLQREVREAPRVERLEDRRTDVVLETVCDRLAMSDGGLGSVGLFPSSADILPASALSLGGVGARSFASCDTKISK